MMIDYFKKTLKPESLICIQVETKPEQLSTVVS